MKIKNKSPNFRAEKVQHFFKTEHFLLRQYERKVSDELVKYALQSIRPSSGKHIIMVSGKLVKKFLKKDETLFIIVHQKSLIICYLGEIHLSKSKYSGIKNYQIVNE